MAIKTSTFSGWRLSGKDAEAFLEQVNSELAQATLARGRKLDTFSRSELAEEYLKNGYVIIKPTTK